MSVGKFVCVLSCCSCLPFTSAKAEEFNCTAFAGCEALGYTVNASECSENGLKVLCPLDTSKAFCKTNTIKPISCTVGSVLGGDQLCYEAGKLPDGISPIGIIFDTENQLAVALTDVNSSGAVGSTRMYWSNNYYDITSLTNCQYSDGDTAVDSCGVDGRANTTAILNCGSSCGGTPAATACNSYNPSGCAADFCKKTQWFLPSMRDLAKIYANKSVINASLSLLNSWGAEILTENYYWSSTEYSGDSAWTFSMGNGDRYWNTRYNGNGYVRPVIYYGEPKTEICVYENQCSGYTLLSGNENWYTFASSGNEINIGAESCTSCGITKWRNSCNATSYEDCFSNNCMDYEPDCIDNPSSEYCNKAKEECAKCCKSCPNAECFSAW